MIQFLQKVHLELSLSLFPCAELYNEIKIFFFLLEANFPGFVEGLLEPCYMINNLIKAQLYLIHFKAVIFPTEFFIYLQALLHDLYD